MSCAAGRIAGQTPGQTAGQALSEYLIGLTCVVLVLFVPLFDGRSVAGALANALHDGFATLSFLLSLC